MTNSTYEQLFSRPLILGASVSAGYGTNDNGPAAVVSKLINPKARITNKARSGHTSLESTNDLDYHATSPSIVLAFDLFFWDATRNEVGKDFEKNVRRLLSAYQEKGTPMIIGRVPIGVKFPEAIRAVGLTKAAVRVNSLLEELCTPDKNCILYDPKLCFDHMKGPVSPEGKPYFMDSMHTTETGNLFCANIFVKSDVIRNLRPERPHSI